MGLYDNVLSLALGLSPTCALSGTAGRDSASVCALSHGREKMRGVKLCATRRPDFLREFPMPHRWNEHEHRWGERFRVNVLVNVTATTFNKVNGRLSNISLSGALIRADVDIPLNSLIEVSFMPPPTRIGVVL